MATVDVYADDPNEIDESAAPVWFNDSHVSLFMKLLPTGPAWPRETDTVAYALLLALSQVLMRTDRRGDDLQDEAFPETMFELLPDWERVFDLPGACDLTPPTLLVDRRAAVTGRWLGFGDPNPQLYLDVLTGNNITGEIITNPPFVPGSPVGCPITQEEWAYAWIVNIVHGANESSAECQIQAIAPQHTLPIFEFVYSSWFLRTPDASYAGRFFGGTWNAATYCIVGSDGEIQTSDDLDNWTKQTQAGAYAGSFTMVESDDAGLLVAVGTGPEIQSSADDGVTWTARTSTSVANLTSVDHDQSGLWLAGGVSAELETSPDGITWTSRTPDGAYAGNIRDVLHDRSSLWMFVGSAAEIQTSSDAITWTAQSSAGSFAGEFRGIAHSGSLWVICGETGEIQTSPDGITWTVRTSPVSTQLNKAKFADGLFWIAGESGVILSSPDGITWTAETSGLAIGLNHVFNADDVRQETMVLGDDATILTAERTVYRA